MRPIFLRRPAVPLKLMGYVIAFLLGVAFVAIPILFVFWLGTFGG